MALNLNHMTAARYVALLRERYRDGNVEDRVRVARRILGHIADGDATDLQVRNAFGLTAGQWTTLKAKMQSLSDHYDAIKLAQGE